MNSKKAKFFCENCGAQVEQNAKFCRSCGRFFTSVRCPSCSFVGIAGAFTNGCPNCGYADAEHKPKESAGSIKARKTSGDSPLPAWIYLFTIVGLLGIIGAVIYLFSVQ